MTRTSIITNITIPSGVGEDEIKGMEPRTDPKLLPRVRAVEVLEFDAVSEVLVDVFVIGV